MWVCVLLVIDIWRISRTLLKGIVLGRMGGMLSEECCLRRFWSAMKDGRRLGFLGWIWEGVTRFSLEAFLCALLGWFSVVLCDFLVVDIAIFDFKCTCYCLNFFSCSLAYSVVLDLLSVSLLFLLLSRSVSLTNLCDYLTLF